MYVRMCANIQAINYYFLKGHFCYFAWMNAKNLVTRYTMATNGLKASYGVFSLVHTFWRTKHKQAALGMEITSSTFIKFSNNIFKQLNVKVRETII